MLRPALQPNAPRASDGVTMHPATTQPPGSQHVAYATAPTSLGVVQVAMTATGVVAIRLGLHAPPWDAGCTAASPGDRPSTPQPVNQKWLDAVLATIEHPHLPCTAPLIVGGTAFQRQVWAVLCTITPGTTLSYSGIAHRLGRPTAARAVANACGANALAVVIPCHRAVHSNGGKAGYRWGVDIKHALLAREAAAMADKEPSAARQTGQDERAHALGADEQQGRSL